MTSAMKGWVAATVIVLLALVVLEDFRRVVLWPARFTMRVMGW